MNTPGWINYWGNRLVNFNFVIITQRSSSLKNLSIFFENFSYFQAFSFQVPCTFELIFDYFNKSKTLAIRTPYSIYQSEIQLPINISIIAIEFYNS